MRKDVKEASASEVVLHRAMGFLTSWWKGGRLKSEDYVVTRWKWSESRSAWEAVVWRSLINHSRQWSVANYWSVITDPKAIAPNGATTRNSKPTICVPIGTCSRGRSWHTHPPQCFGLSTLCKLFYQDDDVSTTKTGSSIFDWHTHSRFAAALGLLLGVWATPYTFNP